MEIQEIAKAVKEEAHRQYLDAWEIKTQVAEANGEWTPEVRRMILETLQKNASSLELLAGAVWHHFEELEKDPK